MTPPSIEFSIATSAASASPERTASSDGLGGGERAQLGALAHRHGAQRLLGEGAARAEVGDRASRLSPSQREADRLLLLGRERGLARAGLHALDVGPGLGAAVDRGERRARRRRRRASRRRTRAGRPCRRTRRSARRSRAGSRRRARCASGPAAPRGRRPRPQRLRPRSVLRATAETNDSPSSPAASRAESRRRRRRRRSATAGEQRARAGRRRGRRRRGRRGRRGRGTRGQGIGE